jgi:hypothetical protein
VVTAGTRLAVVTAAGDIRVAIVWALVEDGFAVVAAGISTPAGGSL